MACQYSHRHNFNGVAGNATAAIRKNCMYIASVAIQTGEHNHIVIY